MCGPASGPAVCFNSNMTEEKGQPVALRPGIGLALGGGVTYTIASVGVFRALQEAKIPVTAVSGTSGGALIGAAIAAGLPADEIARQAVRLRWHDIAWPIPTRTGLLNGRPMARFVERITGRRLIEELAIPFSAVATNINTGEEVRFTSGPLGMAVQASSAIPGLFQPVPLGKCLLVDGGITDNVPVAAVREHRSQVVVAVDVLRFFEGRQEHLRWGLELVLKSYQAMVKIISESQERRADLVVMPNVAGCSFASFRDAGKLIERGEEAMRAMLPRLRAILAEYDRGPSLGWD